MRTAWGPRPTRLWQLPRDLTSLHTRENVCPHSAQQIINCSGRFPTWDAMWVLRKPKNQGQDLLLATNIKEMHWRQYALLHDICWFYKSLRHCEQRSATEHPTKIRMPWTFVKLVSALYPGMKTSVSLRKELLEPFEAENGMKRLFTCPHTVLDFSFYGIVRCFL